MECILNPGISCDNVANYAYVIWIFFGVMLMFLEFIVPGIFIIFFGMGAVITGGLHYIFNFGFGLQVTSWIVTSFLIILLGAKFLKDLFPSDQTFEPTMEEHDNGRIVEVVKSIHEGKKGGRIKFQGTHWDAISRNGEIAKGGFAKIIERINLTYYVSIASPDEIQQYLDSIPKIEEED